MPGSACVRRGCPAAASSVALLASARMSHCMQARGAQGEAAPGVFLLFPTPQRPRALNSREALISRAVKSTTAQRLGPIEGAAGKSRPPIEVVTAIASIALCVARR